jgi:hypothetical protein
MFIAYIKDFRFERTLNGRAFQLIIYYDEGILKLHSRF